MNWFNNNFGYRANTATANTTIPGSTTIGLGSGSIGLGPGAYGPIGTGTGTTDTGSNNGSTTSGNNTGWWGNVWGNVWGNGTGWGNNGSIQFNPSAIGFGFWNSNVNTGSTSNNCGVIPVGCGFNNGNTGWGNRSNESGRYYNYANQYQPYDDFLIRGFNPGYEQCNLVATRNRRRNVEQTIDTIGQVGFWGRGFGYPQSLYGLNY